MARIFISHSSLDDRFVEQLAADLRVAGHEPWTDDQQITPGQSILSRMQDALHACRYLIVVLSEAAVRSKWVEKEWQSGMAANLPRGVQHIVPVYLEECETPELLKPCARADFTKSYAVGFAMLLSTLGPRNVGSHFAGILSLDTLRAIEHAARTDAQDHIRVACAHAIWSCRPDRAKPLLEDARDDLSQVVRDHARKLLDQY